MKFSKLALLCAAMLILDISTKASDWYVSQTGAGAATGADAANAKSWSWLNTVGHWGSTIQSGDTIHLCGVLTNTVTVLGNGVTIRFEAGSSISLPVGTPIYAANRSGITVDGNGVGFIQNTANGTGLANQQAVCGIMASGCANLTVKNLAILNIYVHTNLSDVSMDGGMGGGVYVNGSSGTLLVMGCTFSNVPWCVNLLGPAAYAQIYSNIFINYDHGIGMGVSGTYGADVSSNNFGSTSNWDTTADAYHHDGIHYFGTATVTNLTIRNNNFNGSWGTCNTAHVFLETAPPNVLLYNNVFLQSPGNYLNDGMLVCGGTNCQIYNNTFMGSGVVNSTGIQTCGTGTILLNNLFSGFTTFLVVPAKNAMTFNHNVYANITYGGNPPFLFLGVACASLQAWQSAIGSDANSITTINAKINADGSLQSGSPAIGMATNLSSIFTTDITGATRNGSWDAGAIAANGGHTILNPPLNLHVITAGQLAAQALGPFGQWIFAEGSGYSTADVSGNGNTGNFVNYVGWIAGPNQNGAVFGFSAGNSYVGIASQIVADTNAVTFCGWAKSGPAGGAVFLRGSDNRGTGGWSIFLAENVGSPALASIVTTSPSIAQQTVVGKTTIAAGTWYFIAGVWNPGVSLQIYVNGVLEGTTQTSSTTLRTGTAGIALGVANNGSFFDGTISDVRIYPRALAASEISALYTTGAQ
jgi:Concanavalin A-like lectin/glucanases superfamily